MSHNAANSVFKAAGLTVFERGWLSSNNVLFDAGATHESVLVDSGHCSHAAQTVALVRRALGSRRLDRLVNSHLHSDHCGGNRALHDEFDCLIDVPAGERDAVDRWDESALSYTATGQSCPRFRCTGTLQGAGEVVLGSKRWQVIASPGHDPESVVFHQPEFEVLISADALWENGFGVVFPELEGASGFDAVRTTLERLGGLRAEWIIPGHGAPFQGLNQAIGRAQRRLDAFVADPRRHARHAAKVLIKFHLLTVQRVELADLLAWIDSTAYLPMIHSLYFDPLPFGQWSLQLLDELAASGALAAQGGTICNA